MKRKRTAYSTRRKKSQSKKTKYLFWKKGQIALYLLLAVIILGAFVLVSGGPQFDLTPDGNQPAGDMVIETPDPLRDSLQLKTIRFQACGTRTAVDFLIDTSGSMSVNNKLTNLKDALNAFASNLEDKSVVGIRRFSASPNTCYPSVTSRLVPINFYSANKTVFSQQVSALCANGGTNTGTAFAAELTDLTAAVANPAFKDTPLNLVFISDGIPEGQPFDNGGGNCQQYQSTRFPVCSYYSPADICRCFDSSQDPTANPSIAQQIQALKNINGKPVRIFSVLVYDPTYDSPFKSNLDTMMTNIATNKTDYYQTSDPTAIKGIYAQIADKICEANGGNPTP